MGPGLRRGDELPCTSFRALLRLCRSLPEETFAKHQPQHAEEAQRAVSKHAEWRRHKDLPSGGASFETAFFESLLRMLEIETCTN
jgi:hypothetical protein